MVSRTVHLSFGACGMFDRSDCEVAFPHCVFGKM